MQEAAEASGSCCDRWPKKSGEGGEEKGGKKERNIESSVSVTGARAEYSLQGQGCCSAAVLVCQDHISTHTLQCVAVSRRRLVECVAGVKCARCAAMKI